MKIKINLVPESPGIYLLKNDIGIVCYIGKSKNLRKRLSSYFEKKQLHGRLQYFFPKIKSFDYFLCNNETEALLLEQNLIKKYRPKYNILLTDDKQYPYIQITNEQFPRIIYTRRINKKKGSFFGPFPDSIKPREIYYILNRIFPLRKCKTLPKKSCIYYDIKECLGPCINKINPSLYLKYVIEIKKFFRGKSDLIINNLKKKCFFIVI